MEYESLAWSNTWNVTFLYTWSRLHECVWPSLIIARPQFDRLEPNYNTLKYNNLLHVILGCFLSQHPWGFYLFTYPFFLRSVNKDNVCISVTYNLRTWPSAERRLLFLCVCNLPTLTMRTECEHKVVGVTSPQEKQTWHTKWAICESCSSFSSGRERSMLTDQILFVLLLLM